MTYPSPSQLPHHFAAREPRHSSGVGKRDSFNHKIILQEQLLLWEGSQLNTLKPEPAPGGFSSPLLLKEQSEHTLLSHWAQPHSRCGMFASDSHSCHMLKLISQTKICFIGNENEQQTHQHKNKCVASRTATTFVIKKLFPLFPSSTYDNLVMVPFFQDN